MNTNSKAVVTQPMLDAGHAALGTSDDPKLTEVYQAMAAASGGCASLVNSNAVEALKPCPFCDGELHTEANSAVKGGLVVVHDERPRECPLGGVKVPIDQWNTHASLTTTEDGLAGELASLIRKTDATIGMDDFDVEYTDLTSLCYKHRHAILAALSLSPSGDVVEALVAEGDAGRILKLAGHALERIGCREKASYGGIMFDVDSGECLRVTVEPYNPATATTPQHTTSPDALLRDIKAFLDDVDFECLSGDIPERIDQHLQGGQP